LADNAPLNICVYCCKCDM